MCNLIKSICAACGHEQPGPETVYDKCGNRHVGVLEPCAWATLLPNLTARCGTVQFVYKHAPACPECTEAASRKVTDNEIAKTDNNDNLSRQPSSNQHQAGNGGEIVTFGDTTSNAHDEMRSPDTEREGGISHYEEDNGNDTDTNRIPSPTNADSGSPPPIRQGETVQGTTPSVAETDTSSDYQTASEARQEDIAGNPQHGYPDEASESSEQTFYTAQGNDESDTRDLREKIRKPKGYRDLSYLGDIQSFR